jgi:pimeloyl-ACP methyl ester carboxylesterase
MSMRPSLVTFIEDITNVLFYEDLWDVTLVGHSFAGSVISSVAERMPERIRHLVYLDALVLQGGESSSDRSPARAEAYRQKSLAYDGGLTVPPADPVHFGITDPEMTDWTAARLTPHPLQTYYDKLPITSTPGNGISATYIACSQPLFAATEASRELAKSLPGWGYREIPTGHNAMMTMPAELTEMLIEAAASGYDDRS